MAMRANPGKFENALDEAVWGLSLDGGADEEVGSSSEAPGTWAGLMRDGGELGKALQQQAKDYPNVTGEDRVFLSINGAAGVIVTESSDGFIKVRYYPHVTDLNKDWKELEEDLALDDEYDDGDSEPESGTSGAPELKPGYAYELAKSEGDWKKSSDEPWDTVVIGDDEIEKAEHVGQRQIDGALVCVFYNGETRCYYAQTKAFTGNPVPGFAVGDRVQLHPGTDAWMRGDRYGEVVKVGREKVSVKLDKSNRVVRLAPRNIQEVIERAHRPNGLGDTLYEVQIADKQCTTKWVPAHGRAARGFDNQEDAEAVAREFRGRGVKARVMPVNYASNARRHHRNGDLSSLEITIPDWNGEWQQISGDQNPGAYGGVIATADGDRIELIEIQPVVEYVGEGEAKDIGFPFWSREATYDLDDLDPSDATVKSAMKSSGLERETLEGMTPDNRALAIAEACLEYGYRVEEGQSGWAKDVLGSRVVHWASGEIEGYKHIADADDTFRREVLGQKYEVIVDGAHESWHEDEDEAVEAAEDFEGHAQVKDSFDGEIVWDSKESGSDEHEPNRSRGHRRNSSSSVLEQEGTLDQLIEMQAETLNPSGQDYVPSEVKNALTVTPELRKTVLLYEAALLAALEEVVQKYPPEDGASAEDLFDDKAPYLVLMTLRGEGVGIWDGDWEAHYSNTDAVQKLLEQKLSKYADRGGSGRISEALDMAVYEAMRETGYGFDDETYVPIDEGGVLGIEFADTELPPERAEEIANANGIDKNKFWKAVGRRKPITRGEVDAVVSRLGGRYAKNRHPKGGSHRRNPSGSVRWNVFLNGEMLEPVYLQPGLDAVDVKADLVAQGYDPRIVVDQPPARRTNLPPHYRTTPGGGTRMSANRRHRTKLVANGGRK